MKKILLLLTLCSHYIFAQNYWTAVSMTPSRRAYDYTTTPNGNIYMSTGGQYDPYEPAVYKSTNNGTSFTKVATLGTSGSATGIAAVSNDTVVVGTTETVFVSKDAGVTWNTSNTGLTSSTTGVFDIHRSSNKSLFLIEANNSKFFKSVNNGASWTYVSTIPSTNIVARKFEISPSGIIYAISDSLYKSVNNGVSWTNIGVANGTPQALYITPNGDLYVGYSVQTGVILKDIYKLSNGSSTWIKLNSTSFNYNYNFSDLVVNNNGNIFATFSDALNGYGCMRSIDGGATFNKFTSGLPDAYDYSIYLISNGYLLISNGGSGIYITKTTSEVSSGIDNEVQLLRISISPIPVSNKATLYFNLKASEEITIDLYDTQGRKVKRLLSEKRAGGDNRLEFNTDDLTNGVYHCVIKAGGNSATENFVVIN